MMRCCTKCQAAFTPRDLAREESKEMAADRKAQGLHGVLFRRYSCPQCGFVDIFVDVTPLEGESVEDFQRRKEELEASLRQLHTENTDVVVQGKVAHLSM
jgi:hypothetical protein